MPADDRARLEQLCRYLLRPPVAQDRLHLTRDGRILVELKSEWADGTTHLVFEPLELLEKLAALTPRPRINLVLYARAPSTAWTTSPTRPLEAATPERAWQGAERNGMLTSRDQRGGGEPCE